MLLTILVVPYLQKNVDRNLDIGEAFIEDIHEESVKLQGLDNSENYDKWKFYYDAMAENIASAVSIATVNAVLITILYSVSIMSIYAIVVHYLYKIFVKRNKQKQYVEIERGSNIMTDNIQDNGYEWDSRFEIADETYRKVFELVKDEQGMKDVDVKLTLHNGTYSYSRMYSTEDSREVKPEVGLLKSSQQLGFRTDAIHELEHIRTNRQEIRKIGTDNFKDLLEQRKYPASVAFRGITEYLAWKAACTYNAEEKRNTGIIKRKKGEDEREWMHECVDSIAAYKAYYDVHSDLEQMIFSTNDKEYYKVAELISFYAEKWPLSMQEFEESGKQIHSLLTEKL